MDQKEEDKMLADLSPSIHLWTEEATLTFCVSCRTLSLMKWQFLVGGKIDHAELDLIPD